MVRERESKEERNANQLKKLEKNFTNQVDKFNLKDLSLDELANRYETIDQQSQMLKGLILLEARNRFASNNEFGDWIKSVKTLCLDRQEVRTRYMNFARYFKERELGGISLSAAYQISAPANQAVANEVYEYASGKNLSVAEVRKKIIELKNAQGLPLPPESKAGDVLLMSDHLKVFVDKVLNDVDSLTPQESIDVLKACLKQMQKKEKNLNQSQEEKAIE